jgi:tetratricopeptide (TPR) repeat protein
MIGRSEPTGASAVNVPMQNAQQAAAALTAARQNFARGQIDAARESCGEILRAIPEHAGALHLLGIIAHQDGDQPRAEDLLRRAAESADTTPLYLLSYADLCCKAVDHEAAVGLTKQALALDDASSLGWFCLGDLHFESRQFDDSRRCFERALQLEPHFWQARVKLAMTLRRLGDSGAALGQFERLRAEEPDNAEVIGNFAALLQDLGRYAEALVQAEHAIAKQPDALDPYLRAAQIDVHLGRYWPALARLGAIEERWPDEITLLALKAHLLRLVDHYDEAIVLCRRALAKKIESPDLLRAYGLALHLVGEDSEALTVLDRASTENPALALADKAVLLSQLGRFDEACAAFEAALLREPGLADAWYNKSNAKTHTQGDPDIVAMQRLLDGHCAHRDRLLLNFALGKAHWDIEDTDQAFAHWHEGNCMKRAIVDYDAGAESSRMEAIVARPLDTGAASPATGIRLSDVPVFVVGMPRCGSTLVEQILASHPQVHGAGELVGLRSLFEGHATDALDTATADSERRLAEIAEIGLDRLRRFSTRADRIVDKDLANFLHLGVIHRIFPHARIIHCRRDPLDTCFSAYTKLFLGEFGFTYDLRELGLYYREYHALMAHWRSVLPSRIFMEVDYETLVAAPREESRRMLSFLGLPWNEACVRFFESTRTVSTASMAQVRRPIFRSSVGRARSLGTHLQPLIEALGDLAPSG